ncbi:MAG: DUF262 domain-containing HNH endonuclease family protein [Hyphomonadaceae bacterium]|nr:DUF262 domain-containing HNH endonuclease family protein [Hyphomonadaceae bacterium]
MASEFGDTPIGLTSKIVNVAGVLTQRFTLKVPRYQRPYSWTGREVRRLIQDLRRAVERNAAYYYVGEIVLVRSNDGKLEIADGQQRLATLTMIIAYVRDRLQPNRAKHYQQLIMNNGQPRLMLRRDDANFFLGHVQEPGNMAAMAAMSETGITSKDLMIAAVRTIEEELGDTSDRELDQFMSFVARCTTMNQVDADERGAAATVFATVNDRGLELSAADNFKCDLLENSGLTETQAEAAARKWEELEDLLGRDRFGVLLNWAPFLLTGAHLVSPGDLAAFRNAIADIGGVQKFLFERLPRFARALSDIFNEDVSCGAASADINRRIKMMKLVDRKWERWDWLPAAIAFLSEHSSQTERARRFFQALDRFTFACEFAIVDKRVQERRFARAMRGIGDDKALYGAKGALELTPTEHMKFIERINRSGKKAAPRRLLMLRLEASLPGGSALDIDADAGVEHILPEAGGPEWDLTFPDKQLRAEVCNLIGNLALLKRDQNTAAANLGYAAKREIYFKWPNAPIHAVTRDLERIYEWTLDTIYERQERLVTYLCMDWDLMRGGESTN